MIPKANYCEICKWQCKTFSELQDHIHEKHQDIERRERRRKSSWNPPPNTRTDGTPAPEILTTLSPERLLARELETSSMVQKAYGIKREGTDLVLTRAYEKLSDREKARVQAALIHVTSNWRLDF